MKIAILGFDVEGRASYEYFAEQGHEMTICDQNPEVEAPDGVPSVLGENYLNDLDRFDLLVRTPGLHPQKILSKNPSVAGKITTLINEFFKVCPTRNVIGITGTKGKGTTATLIAKMLEAGGRAARLGGNIGLPPLNFLSELKADSWVILELSSFQLIDIKYSPHIGVCLMVVPEHLNWHPDINDYTTAKSQLFAHQSADDIAIYFAENELSKLIASSSHGQKIPYYAQPGAYVDADAIVINDQAVCRTADLKLLGEHNWQNACAAVTAVWPITQDLQAIRSVLTSFSGLEHRLEFVRELNNVSYYNDSFGTAPETAIAAIKAFQRPQVVILGGQGKGVGFDELAKVIKNNGHVARTLVIGETRQEIIRDLQLAGFTDYVESAAQTMPEIVTQARDLADELARSSNENVVVLLSTACTSFDMFDNYKQRGELFKQAVQALV